jgi:hypothetical protein
MIGDSTLPIRGDRLHSANIDKEGNELPTPLGEFLRARQVPGIVGEEFGVMYPQHPGTRPRGGNDIIIAGKGVEYLQGDCLGIGPVTGVVGGLAATGLSTRDPDRAPRVFEQFDSRKAYCRSEQIDQTRDE